MIERVVVVTIVVAMAVSMPMTEVSATESAPPGTTTVALRRRSALLLLQRSAHRRAEPRKYFEDGNGAADDPPATVRTSGGRPLVDDVDHLEQIVVQDRDSSTFSDSATYWEDHVVDGAAPPKKARPPKQPPRKEKPSLPPLRATPTRAPPAATPPREYPTAPPVPDNDSVEKKTKEAEELTAGIEKMTKTVEAYEANEKAKNAAVEAGVPVDDEDARNEAPQPETLGQEAVRKLGVATADGPSVNDMVKTMEEENDLQNTPDTR